MVTVEVLPGETVPASVWVVNRGAATVDRAVVRVLQADEEPQIESRTDVVTIRPRARARIDLRVPAPRGQAGVFRDALLVVDGVGSILVRAIVGQTPEQARASSAEPQEGTSGP